MRFLSTPVQLFLVSSAMLLLGSCSGSRWAQGFEYRGSQHVPDVSGTITAPDDHVSMVNDGTEKQVIIPSPVSPPAPGTPGSSLTETEALGNIIITEMQAAEGREVTVDTRETMNRMASRYAESQHKTLTTKQLRKLDRYAKKLEKKQQQSRDVHWGPSNNLELFLLIGAGVGLVVGILGIGFGWFVFLVLALVYLYFKLLKNN